MKHLAHLAVFTVFVGCASAPPPHQRFAKRESSKAPKSLKVMLVAAADDTAAFAEEILRQKALWLSRGVKPEEIGCYVKGPDRKGWAEDFEHFAKQRAALADCFPATLSVLRAHVEAAAKANPEYFYFYVTGHGNAPSTFLYSYHRSFDSDGNARAATGPQLEMEKAAPALKQFAIPFGEGRPEEEDWQASVIAGEPIDNFVLTPLALKTMLQKLPLSTSKTVVVQACFSGGFVEIVNDVKNLTILTAAAPDRTSFGCATGADTTYFGGAYLESVAEAPGIPSAVDWKRVYQRTTERVESAEIPLPRGSESRPQYASSR